MKTIQQILMLSKNPHYRLSEEELKVLEQYRLSQSDDEEKQNKNEFTKHDTSFQKHDVRLKQE